MHPNILTPALSVAIFSYNRGPYLRNCVDSVRRHLPGVKCTVYDDGSTDPHTQAVLKDLGKNVRHMNTATSDRHGGFYRNMQAALDESQTPYLILLQDDLQVVRTLDAIDLKAFNAWFQSRENIAFLSPVFLKGGRRKDFLNYYYPDTHERLYHWRDIAGQVSKDGPVPKFYTDVCVLCVDRLRRIGWQFSKTELANGEQAAHHFDEMPQMADPFVFYVPEEPVYRGRVMTLGSKIATKMAGDSVKTFLDLTPVELMYMRKRSLAMYPFAEDFINTADPKVHRPYRFNVYRTRLLPRLLNKFEKLIRGE